MMVIHVARRTWSDGVAFRRETDGSVSEGRNVRRVGVMIWHRKLGIEKGKKKKKKDETPIEGREKRMVLLSPPFQIFSGKR